MIYPRTLIERTDTELKSLAKTVLKSLRQDTFPVGRTTGWVSINTGLTFDEASSGVGQLVRDRKVRRVDSSTELKLIK